MNIFKSCLFYDCFSPRCQRVYHAAIRKVDPTLVVGYRTLNAFQIKGIHPEFAVRPNVRISVIQFQRSESRDEFQRVYEVSPCSFEDLSTKYEKKIRKSSKFWALTRELQLLTQRLVYAFDGLFDRLGISEDLFSVGPFSRIVADQLVSLPR